MRLKVSVAVAVVIAAIALTSCGNSETRTVDTSTKVAGAIPLNCTDTKILEALMPTVKNATFIDTKWTPAVGTDLEAILNNGGIACTYGDQPNEIGVTVSWVKGEDIFSARKQGWIDQGYAMAKLSNPNISQTYFIGQAQDATHEFHRWEVNFLYGDIWIQVQSSMGISIDDNEAIVKAAIESVGR